MLAAKMGSPLPSLREVKPPVTFVCVACSCVITDVELDRDEVLFRTRITVKCHGKSEVFALTDKEVGEGTQPERYCFGGH